MSLRKIRTVAASEFTHLVKTKVFLLSLFLVPAFSVALGCLSGLFSNGSGGPPRRFAILDRSGSLQATIVREASLKTGAGFVPVLATPAGRSGDALRALALRQIQRGELFAFLEIPSGAVESPGGPAQTIAYYSKTPADTALPEWLSGVVDREILRQRLKNRGVDPALVQASGLAVGWAAYALSSGPSGPIATPVHAMGPSEALVPAGAMLLLFLMVMLTAPQMMSSVIEEKMSRISEMLLASVTPFDLMVGKLAACCGASALVGALYLALGMGLAAHFGCTALISGQAVCFFLLFLVLAVFLHGSMYMAVGAACSQPKDAQGLLAPLVLVTAIPLAAIRSLIQDPSGALPTFLSYFPLSAPFVLCFRVNSPEKPSHATLAAAIAVTLSATLLCVWAASRIFRIGLLSQGKGPTVAQLFRWIFAD